MAVGDIDELTLTGSLVGQVHVNTYHFKHTGATGGANTLEQQLIDEWQSTCQAPYLGIFGSAYKLDVVSARQICGATTPYRARIDETVNLPGTRATASIQSIPWLAALVRERTQYAGKSFQGRNFYAIGGEDDFTQNAIQSILSTAIAAYNTALMALFGPSGTSVLWRYSTFSHTIKDRPGGNCTNASAEVLSLSVSPYVTSMRSRRSKTGA